MRKHKIKSGFFAVFLSLCNCLYAQTPVISNQIDTIKIGSDTIAFINRTRIIMGDKIFNDLVTYSKVVNDKTIESFDKIIFDSDVYESNGNLIDGRIGVIKNYHSNGQLREIYTVIFGRMIDYYTEFYMNGTIKTLGRYKLFNCFDELNHEVVVEEVNFNGEILQNVFKNIISIKTGAWYYFSQNGNLDRMENY